MKKINFGILSTAKIGREAVIPAIQKGRNCTAHAIASQGNRRDAEKCAKKHAIRQVHSTYEELLQDKNIDAVYIPLPNHLHIDWSIRAMEHGKHVLCEKPFALNSNELQRLLRISKKRPDIKIMEAFMYRFHPQWKKLRALVKEGAIGTLSHVETFFSYYNVDPSNIRNKKECGGGALYDIGCYGMSVARFLFDSYPTKVIGIFRYDKKFKTDMLCSATLKFKQGSATFTCSTQMPGHQNVKVFGSTAFIELPVPFNPRPKTNIYLYSNGKKETIPIELCNQYTLQAEAFSDAILKREPVPVSLADSLENMKGIDALFRQNNN